MSTAQSSCMSLLFACFPSSLIELLNLILNSFIFLTQLHIVNLDYFSFIFHVPPRMLDYPSNRMMCEGCSLIALIETMASICNFFSLQLQWKINLWFESCLFCWGESTANDCLCICMLKVKVAITNVLQKWEAHQCFLLRMGDENQYADVRVCVFFAESVTLECEECCMEHEIVS